MNDLVEKHFDDESVPEVSPSDLFNRVNSCSPKAQKSSIVSLQC